MVAPTSPHAQLGKHSARHGVNLSSWKTGRVANGTIGLDIAAKSPPDGYTLTVISASHSVNASLYKDLPYDLIRDFAPITQTTTQPYVLVVNSGLPVRSVADLIATEGRIEPSQLWLFRNRRFEPPRGRVIRYTGEHRAYAYSI